MIRPLPIICLILLTMSHLTTSQNNRRTTPPSKSLTVALPQNQNVRTTPKASNGAATVRRTTPPRLPFTLDSQTAATTTSSGGGGSGGNTATPAPQDGGATTMGLLQTPTPAGGSGGSGVSLPETPAPTTGVSLPNTPPPNVAGSNLPETPTPAASLPPTPPAQGGASLPATPTPQGGVSLPFTPAGQGGVSLPFTLAGGLTPILPQTPGPQQGASSLPQTPSALPTTTRPLPLTPPPLVPSTPDANVVSTIRTLPTTPVQVTAIRVNTTPLPSPSPTIRLPPPTIPPTTTTSTTTTTPTPIITTTTSIITTTTRVAVIVETTPLPTNTIPLITTPKPTTVVATTTTKTVATTKPTLISTPTSRQPTTPPPPAITTPRAIIPTTSLVPIVPITSSTSTSIIDQMDANIMFLLCNDFKLTVPSNNLALYLADLRSKILNIIKAEDASFQDNRLHNIRLTENPDNGKLTLEFSIRPRLRSSEIKSSRVVELVNSQSLKDELGNSYETSCGSYQILSWGENWKCPEKFCSNGGRCNVKSNGRHYCHCTTGYVGRYCDKNMWPLLVLPILFVLSALMVLCCCLYCRRKKRIVVKNFVNTNVEEAVVVVEKEEPAKERPKPLQTFYLPYNKPLSVGFTEAQVGNVGVRSGFPMLGAPMGGHMVTGMVPMGVVPGGQAMCPTVVRNPVEDPEIYYQTMGQKMALAYNDYTFAPNPRASCAGNVVFNGQNNNQSCNGCTNIGTNFSSLPADNNVANDGSGYYHALGQKLAINFDNN